MKLNTQEFIEKARKTHGDKYDYSKVEYINNKTKVCIICPIHGEFWTTPNIHLQGRNCPLCAHPSKLKTLDEFIQEAREIHGNRYDYSLVEYKGNQIKVKIICPIHGIFEQQPLSHLQGFNCPKCNGRGKTNEEWISLAKAVHGDKYDYSETEYFNARTKVCVICPQHGKFYPKPNDHLRGSGCPWCRLSKLEVKVEENLKNGNVDYEKQVRFSWLQLLSLDFYLPQYNIAIECQGKQHFEKVKAFGEGNLEAILKRDERKRQLCAENGVHLVYFLDKKYNKYVENLNIPYFNDTETLLEFLNQAG